MVELLITMPVTEAQVIIGKFVGHLAILGLAVGIGYGGAGLLVAWRGASAVGWESYVAMMGASLALGAMLIWLPLRRAVGTEGPVLSALPSLFLVALLLFLVEEHMSRHILEHIADVAEFDRSPGTGIALQIDVEDAVGVERVLDRAHGRDAAWSELLLQEVALGQARAVLAGDGAAQLEDRGVEVRPDGVGPLLRPRVVVAGHASVLAEMAGFRLPIESVALQALVSNVALDDRATPVDLVTIDDLE